MTDQPRRTSLAFRITALCLAVVAVALAIAGVIAIRLIVTTSQDLAQQTLAAQADVVAGQLIDQGLGARIGGGRVLEVLRAQDIVIVALRPDGRLVGPPDAVAAAKKAGFGDGPTTVSRVVNTQAGPALVEARGTEAGGFALVKLAELAAGATRKTVRLVVLGLGVGLAVAAVAGLALARLLARPLRRAAAVAHDMSRGRRDLQVPVEGPSEVAEVASAVNALAVALARSETGQREFLLSVSHELRTPLTAVTGFAESLADGVVTGEQVPEVGRTIGREAGRLDRLVGDLLDLARLGTDQFRLDVDTVDLTSLIGEAAQVWGARCERDGVPFRLEQPAAPLLVRTDARRLRQVIDGLAENALRVTPAGRPIVLALQAVPGGGAVIQVRDGGPGLAQEDYAVAFDRGALHARYQHVRPVGTGVGLALVRGLVTRMGGEATAAPAAEGGAAFTITLPATPVPG